MAVADDAGASIVGLERRIPGQKLGYFSLDRLRQEIARATAQHFGELIVDGTWLNQLDNDIILHGISLLRWRSEVVNQPHDMPPSRFVPSPTSAHSSSSGNENTM
jgi:hypothetical protein